jgi:hypothetical protein
MEAHGRFLPDLHRVPAHRAERHIRDERAGGGLGRKGRLLAMERQGSLGAAAALRLQENPAQFLPTVQVGISLVGILAGVFGGAAIAGPLGDG